MIDWTLLNLPDPDFMANIGEPPPAIAPTSDGSTRPYYGLLASYKYLRNLYFSERDQFNERQSNQLLNNIWPLFNVEASKFKITKPKFLNKPHNYSKQQNIWLKENSEQPNVTWPTNHVHTNYDGSTKPVQLNELSENKMNQNNKQTFLKNTSVQLTYETTNLANNGTCEATNTEPTISKQPYNSSHSEHPNYDSHLDEQNEVSHLNVSNSHKPTEASHLDLQNETSHLDKPKHGYWPESNQEQRNYCLPIDDDADMIDDELPKNHALPAAYTMWRDLARFMSERAFHWKEAEFEFRRERVAIMYEIQLEHMRNCLLEVALEEFHRQDELMQMERIIMKHTEPKL